MNKTQIVSALAEKAGISKVDAANYINTIFGVIADNIVEARDKVVFKASDSLCYYSRKHCK